jgi:cytochrome c5
MHRPLGPILVCIALAVGGAAGSRRGAAAAAVASTAWETDFRPTNLQVLRNDISAADLKRLMHRYEDALGVSCEYCHAENEETKQVDYASDDNPKKQTARLMIAMLSDINGKYLSQLGDGDYVAPVTCGNCHQGQTTPPTFDPRPRPGVSDER